MLDNDITEVDCFIDTSSIPDAEKALHRAALDISTRGYEDTTQEQRGILEHSTRLACLRSYLLFRKMIEGLYGLDDSDYKVFFELRLSWFLEESSKIVRVKSPRELFSQRSFEDYVEKAFKKMESLKNEE